MKKTALYEEHVKAGAKITEFGGYLMPLSYASVITEHFAIRNSCGIFDISHMGELIVKGPGSLDFLQRIATNDTSKLMPGGIMYSPICFYSGGTVDDVLIYMLSDDKYLCVVNASNTDKDHEWFNKNSSDCCSIMNVSDEYSQIAVQGPDSEALMYDVFKGIGLPRFFRFVEYDGMIISRTGYTGEDGFEIYMKNHEAADIWRILLEKGVKYTISPAGLGARDTLRFEACLPLYGHELSESVSPVEAGLGMFIKFSKKQDFIGKKALLDIMAIKGRRLTGLKMVERGIPRQGYTVNVRGSEAGYVTSGSFCPTLKGNYALAMINPEFTEETGFDVIIRDKPVNAVKTAVPFYKKRYRKEA